MQGLGMGPLADSSYQVLVEVCEIRGLAFPTRLLESLAVRIRTSQGMRTVQPSHVLTADKGGAVVSTPVCAPGWRCLGLCLCSWVAVSCDSCVLLQVAVLGGVVYLLGCSGPLSTVLHHYQCYCLMSVCLSAVMAVMAVL